MLFYQMLLLTIEKYKRSHTKIINLKYGLQHGMKSFNQLMDLIPYQIFKKF